MLFLEEWTCSTEPPLKIKSLLLLLLLLYLVLVLYRDVSVMNCKIQQFWVVNCFPVDNDLISNQIILLKNSLMFYWEANCSANCIDEILPDTFV